MSAAGQRSCCRGAGPSDEHGLQRRAVHRGRRLARDTRIPKTPPDVVSIVLSPETGSRTNAISRFESAPTISTGWDESTSLGRDHAGWHADERQIRADPEAERELRLARDDAPPRPGRRVRRVGRAGPSRTTTTLGAIRLAVEAIASDSSSNAARLTRFASGLGAAGGATSSVAAGNRNRASTSSTASDTTTINTSNRVSRPHRS